MKAEESQDDAVPTEEDLRQRFEELKQQVEAIDLIDPTSINFKSPKRTGILVQTQVYPS